MKITYRELIERLSALSESQLDDTVTVEFDGEYVDALITNFHLPKSTLFPRITFA